MACIISNCIFLSDEKVECTVFVDKHSEAYIADCQFYSSVDSYTFLKKVQVLWIVAKFLFKRKAP